MIYFDNAATTRPSQAAVDAWLRTVEDFGNPSSLHGVGTRADEMMALAREQVAHAIGASSGEITFTSGGTEADNLALRGVCDARPDCDEVVISAVEHPAVYRACRILKKKGYRITKIACSIDGAIDEGELARAVTDRTAIVSFMAVNNETGTVFPVSRIAEIAKTANSQVIVHTDAVQAFGKVPMDVESLGVDLMTLSAHKVHGFKGAGALYVRSGVEVYPILFGGGQEGGLRSGTEAVPAICAFGAAAEAAAGGVERFREQTAKVKARIVEGLEPFDSVIINSAPNASPHILNITVGGHDATDVLLALSERGVCVSKGAACKSNHKNGPSMLMSFGLPVERADNALRLSFSEENTLDEADAFLGILREIV